MSHISIASGARTLLTANMNFYVSALGSDSNPGTLALPWATLQHAMNILASQYDFGGQNATVNIGAGSFAGFGVKSTVGGGNLFWKGAGSSSTTITAGPNDGVFNFGENVTFNAVPSGTTHFFSGLTFSNPSAFGHFGTYVPYPAIQLANLDGTRADIAVTGTNGLPFFFINAPCDVVIFATSPIAINRTGAGLLLGEIVITGAAEVTIQNTQFSVSGGPRYTSGGAAGLLSVADGGVVVCNGFSPSGAFTGNAATAYAAVVDSTGGLLSFTISVQQGGIVT